MLSFDFPLIDTPINTPPKAALCVIILVYMISAAINLKIPDTGAHYPHQERNPIRLIADFSHCFVTLWKDKLGQISLAMTTLFWGAGATLQFIVLKWAEQSLHMALDEATVLQSVTAVGMAIGATAAAHYVPLKKSLCVMPLGIVMGLVVMLMAIVHNLWVAYPLLVIIGILSGFYVVPMNALLQHRGYVLMSAGHSIAVQNFNESISMLTMLALYAVMIRMDLNIDIVIVIFGLFVAASVLVVMRRHKMNQRIFDSVALIGEKKH